MVWRIILYSSTILCVQCFVKNTCLTGYMTDVQSWVDEKGVLLTSDADYTNSIDLSANMDPVPILQQKMTRSSSKVFVKYLSLARCRLNRVPSIFSFRDSTGRDLAQTLEYVSFYGNQFMEISIPGQRYDVSFNASNARSKVVASEPVSQIPAAWSIGLRVITFTKLRELDLRACSIQVLSSNLFVNMTRLEALYIGENKIAVLEANTFTGLRNLIHLDFSRNVPGDDMDTLSAESLNIFEPLVNLTSLDLSFTKISIRMLFRSFGPTLKRLSLCDTGLTALHNDFFNQTSLKILDISDNGGILSRENALRGLENKLEILFAENIGLRTVDFLKGFSRLEILSVAMNEIGTVSSAVAQTMRRLKILDLNKNRVSSWFERTFSLMPELVLLSMKDNSMNIILPDMITDLKDLRFISLSGNFIVCNCHTRDFFDLALNNEQRKFEDIRIGPSTKTEIDLRKTYHNGYVSYNDQIIHREKVNNDCFEDDLCHSDLHEDIEGDFLLLDFHPSTYMCLQMSEGRSIEFSEVVGCNRSQREIDYDTIMSSNKYKLYILFVIPSVMILLAFIFVFRRNFRYCLITMRNSALLSAINKNDVLNEGAIFHYDVFVSYCNEDRSWVLDHLLPHLDKDCSISACLHERDFQVGHSILENIVSCMDRSRSIMLVISKRFLLSQWCQFEMHLAQHRLLETRREDLTLVFLEEVPRRLRPNTLHYLMLTKTYIVWPQDDNERSLFWKRLKKSLLTIKMKQANVAVSLA